MTNNTPLTLYNTLTRKKEVFKPINSEKVTCYSCGPTVYWYAHIGNLRAYVFTDVLRRTLEYNNYTVQHVMNITDFGHLESDADEGEDKMTKGLKREGMAVTMNNMQKLADMYTNAFFTDLQRLNIITPEITPRASNHIQEDIQLIQQLERKGYAYHTDDGIYFDTQQLADYGKLANHQQTEEKAETYSRVQHTEKKHQRDFALWKFNNNLGWDSPWGYGFPGWHIECSVMSTQYLGQPFDIHTGGIDHIQVHHTNEIAQSETAYEMPMAYYWLHNAFIQVNSSKMAKSEGNILIMNDLIEKGIQPLAFKYLCFTAHYRSELNVTDQSLAAAQRSYYRLKDILVECMEDDSEFDSDMADKYRQQFKAAINDDLNTAEALAVVWDLIRSDVPDSLKYYLVEEFDQVLGLQLTEPESFDVPEEVQELVERREQFRQEQRFAEADQLREEIKEKGFWVEDAEDGPKLRTLPSHSQRI